MESKQRSPLGETAPVIGTNQATDDAAALARPHVPTAIAVLAEVLRDPEARPSARVAAANALLDRACGKPIPKLAGTGTDSREAEAPPLSDAERLHRVSLLFDGVKPQGEA